MSDYSVTVKSYDEASDEFEVEILAHWGGADPRHSLVIPGHFLPVIIREYAAPDELVGKVYEVKVGA